MVYGAIRDMATITDRAEKLRYNRISDARGWQIVDGSSQQVQVKDFRMVDGRSKIAIQVSKQAGEPLFMYVSLYDSQLRPLSTDVIDMTSLKTGIAVANSKAYSPFAQWSYYYVSKNRANP
jgi:hypothetical protein